MIKSPSVNIQILGRHKVSGTRHPGRSIPLQRWIAKVSVNDLFKPRDQWELLCGLKIKTPICLTDELVRVKDPTQRQMNTTKCSEKLPLNRQLSRDPEVENITSNNDVLTSVSFCFKSILGPLKETQNCDRCPNVHSGCSRWWRAPSTVAVVCLSWCLMNLEPVVIVFLLLRGFSFCWNKDHPHLSSLQHSSPTAWTSNTVRVHCVLSRPGTKISLVWRD